ncbi:unnamed protein product [Rotaria sp. Silwood2]|nr:unnamed protein product [Rotaria sp. Silwood2]
MVDTRTKIYPLRANSINIHPNARWQQNGLSVSGGNGDGNGINQLTYPLGLYVDDDQTIYVADQDNHRIIEWKRGATNGQVIAGGNEQGSGIHQLSYPSDVIVDKETDSLIICDYENRRVVRWPRRNGTSGETIISNFKCVSLTMNENGFLYVVDFGKNEVRRYRREESQGIVVAGGNGRGNRLDQLCDPWYVFVDQNNSVYVSDCGNHRVMKWMEGETQGIVVAGGQGQGNGLAQLSYPRGVVVDELGTVYVADGLNDRIMCWTKGATQGNVIVGGNGEGEQSNQLNDPFGIDKHHMCSQKTLMSDSSTCSNTVGSKSLQETHNERMEKFQFLVDRYDINPEFAARLRSLEGFEIVFIIDADVHGPYDRNPTRWDELRQTVSIVVDIACVFDPNGIDLFFLNRQAMRNVKNAEQLIPVFAVPPAGLTPMVRALRQVLEEKQVDIKERKLLILIATDGLPTDDKGNKDLKPFERVLRYERKPIDQIPVIIIACTDDTKCIDYLNNLDKKIPKLDVADDYKSEREEIHKAQGADFPFSFGDYVVKILIGAIDSWFDPLDERRVTGTRPPDRHTHREKKKDKCSLS